MQSKEIIIRISEPFINDDSYHYDDEDLSTLGATEVFEAIVIKDNRIESRCRLIGNAAVKHIDDVIVQTTKQYPGKIYSDFREATLIELEASIKLLEEKSYQFNADSKPDIEKLKSKLTQLKRNHNLDKLI